MSKKDTITITIHVEDTKDFVSISTEINCNGKDMQQWVKENGEEATQVRIVRDTYSFLQLRSDPKRIIDLPKLLHGMLIRESMDLPIKETIEVFRTLNIVPATASDSEAEGLVEMARALIPTWDKEFEKEEKEKEEKEEELRPQTMEFGISKAIN